MGEKSKWIYSNCAKKKEEQVKEVAETKNERKKKEKKTGQKSVLF